MYSTFVMKSRRINFDALSEFRRSVYVVHEREYSDNNILRVLHFFPCRSLRDRSLLLRSVQKSLDLLHVLGFLPLQTYHDFIQMMLDIEVDSSQIDRVTKTKRGDFKWSSKGLLHFYIIPDGLMKPVSFVRLFGQSFIRSFIRSFVRPFCSPSELLRISQSDTIFTSSFTRDL